MSTLVRRLSTLSRTLRNGYLYTEQAQGSSLTSCTQSRGLHPAGKASSVARDNVQTSRHLLHSISSPLASTAAKGTVKCRTRPRSALASLSKQEHLPGAVLQAINGIVGSSNLTSAAAELQRHGQDESWHQRSEPHLVVMPGSTEEVSQVVKLCAENRIPLIPFGAGTSLEGHVQAIRGGISLDMRRMNEVLEVNQQDMDCRVQAGITRLELNHYLKDTGLFFPVDPGADASIGGMTATRASGTNAVRYGTMKEVVLGLTAVMPNGEVVRTGSRARKSSAGYDLTHLLVGSEGTLGVVTEVALKLFGQPASVSSAVCPFDDLEGAVDTVICTIQSGIPVARIELLDEVTVRATNKYSHTDLEEKPTLFFEFHGMSEGTVGEATEAVKEIASEFGGGSFKWATTPEERSHLWQARHNAWYAGLALRPGAKGLPTDVCVPISRLSECILQTKEDIESTGFTWPIVGHVGDGNFHVLCVFDPENREELDSVKSFHARLTRRAISMGGTCTGEHGIGVGKLSFLKEEHGDASLELMATLKRALDPMGIMNPGKLGTPPSQIPSYGY